MRPKTRRAASPPMNAPFLKRDRATSAESGLVPLLEHEEGRHHVEPHEEIDRSPRLRRRG
ncbi:hypothetical protein [Streptomyces sp. NPDC058701]|uniref:hypothetical protein n=1 Tax=Streptomyces sp. NPDC058701 TaxID=3346608 RepID=UPI00364A33D5